MSQITQHLGVGNNCGSCIPAAKALLNDNIVHKYIPMPVNETALVPA